ncbi:MAG: hypothetical protein QXQ39_04670 [Conexivisphaerales archaeon]
MLVNDLSLAEAVMAAAIIVVGGTVEGYGYGLSLGTRWPYTRDMPRLAKAGDPEVWHRLLSTLLGLNSLAILILDPSLLELTGFLLVAITALLGLATLYVLSGKVPSVFQGLHDVLAYSTMLTYLMIYMGMKIGFLQYLLNVPAFHSFYFAIFMGGFVTGQRGFKKAIGYFVLPKTSGQVVWSIHGLAVLILVYTLAITFPEYDIALLLALLQVAVGFMSYQAVNQSASKPGILIPIHQLLSVLIALAIFFTWHIL